MNTRSSFNPKKKDSGITTQRADRCFLLYRKDCVTLKYENHDSYRAKNPPGEIALRRNGMMSLTRPAAGGESCKAGFYFVTLAIYFQQNRLYPTIIKIMARSTIKNDLGRIRTQIMPMPIQKIIRPHNRLISSSLETVL